MLERRYYLGIGTFLGCLLLLLYPGTARSQNLPANNGAPPGAPAGPVTQPAATLPSSTNTAPPTPPAHVAPYSATTAQPYPSASQVPPGQAAPQGPAVYPANATTYPVNPPANPGFVPTPDSANGASKPPAKPTDWSIGAGLLFADAGLVGLSNQVSISGTAYTPVIRTSVFLERRLWDHVYLLLQPDFSYRKYYRDNGAISSGLDIDRSTSVGASMGLRWVANPGDLVEIGMTHLFDSDWTYQKGSTQISQVNLNSYVQSNVQQAFYDVGLSTGLVAEYMLMRQLWLRIHVSLVRATYSKVTTRYQDQNGPTNTEHNSIFDLSLLASPRLEIRLTW
jgi:hypothetical protein